ncbi:helix-turn-helix domain-containing protein [Collinsella ihumii]|uniref:Helix-turn-helix domain-containing protein n=1 Tax=Collinsella ihumii TaxID=1720204 RepID=A0ABT7XEJ3_9ACTN|nr:helix-turn-helix domain-containing protein [Collinsella ihumii]MDN0063815.1 helix-turn-helix domain-containing protein [Collinsella ihumii]
MGRYVTAEIIKSLREGKRLTQRELASAVGVTDKAVSKWESGRGLPDISLIDALAQALGVSVAELLTGDVRENANRAGNMMRSKFYVCPICGNVVHAMGEGSFSCCGVQLMSQEAEDADEDDAHRVHVERIENDWYLTLDHPMTKQHYLSFATYVTSDTVSLKKLYPEQSPEVRFPMRGSGLLYVFCNQHGLFRLKTPRIQRTR